jgi:hypothetical protein
LTGGGAPTLLAVAARLASNTPGGRGGRGPTLRGGGCLVPSPFGVGIPAGGDFRKARIRQRRYSKFCQASTVFPDQIQNPGIIVKFISVFIYHTTGYSRLKAVFKTKKLRSFRTGL